MILEGIIMRGYKHLTFHDRLKIEKMKKAGRKQNEIAAALHVSESTVSRELRRGVYERIDTYLVKRAAYSPDKAQARYEYNKTAKGRPLKIGNDHRLAEYIERRIAEGRYSPGAVLAEIANSNTLTFSVSICAKTLYRYIDTGVFLRITNKDLPFRGKRRKHRTRHVKPSRVSAGDSIEKRPELISKRAEFGHWEMDTVMSSKAGKGCLLVLTERVTRQEVCKRLPDHKALTIVQAIDLIERRYGGLFPRLFKSITIDNGCEFSDCYGIERSIH